MSPIRLFLLLLAGIALAGCSPPPTSLLVDTPTRISAPTLVATPTLTALPTPSPTNTPIIKTPTIAPTLTHSPTPATGTMRIKLYFVALEDNGKSGKKIGCNDSIVAVERTIPFTQAPLTAALKELLAIKERNIGQAGLYNSLANANLKIENVAIVNGVARIELSGTLGLGGVCDDPRAEAQLKELALQFATVKQVSIMLNGIPIERALSGR